MRSQTTKLTALFSAIVFAVALGCGGDDEENGNGNNDSNGNGSGGEASFQISGDIEGEKSGHAALIPDPNIDSVQLAISDLGPQTFSLTFIQQGTSEVPSEGEYSVGGPTTSDFHATYVDVEGDATEYSEFTEQAGTLEFTSSSETSVSGTFELTLPIMGEGIEAGEGEIVITEGEFTAVVD